MKLITYALWGDNPKYNIGAIKNCDLASIHYPDWISRFYVAKNTPEKTIKILESKKNTQVIEINEVGDWRFTIKRFIPFSEKDVEVFISRDCDSRISSREVTAVNIWLNSNKKFHIMRDHPFHGNFPILAGMFGAKNGIITDIEEKMKEYIKKNIKETYHFDQIFLLNYIWPLIKNDNLTHDEFFSSNNRFPSIRINNEFVGESFNEYDQPDSIGRNAIINYLKA